MDQNKERHDCDNSDLDEDAGTKEINITLFKKISTDLPGIDLETYNSGTSVVTPEVPQSDAEHINLILVGNNGSSAKVTNLVDEIPFGGGDTIDVAQEYVSTKEELDPPNLEVEDVSKDNTVPTFHECEDFDSTNSHDEEENVHPLRRTHGASHKQIYVNSEGL